jgi:hypothetical protein
MIKLFRAAVLAILVAGPAFAGGLGSTVNISTTTNSVFSDRITEVEVDSIGTYTFPDPLTAPILSQQSQALATALVELGVPMGTVANVQGTLSIGSDETEDRIVTSNYNPTDNPDYVIGDPDDPFTWIAIGDERLHRYHDHLLHLLPVARRHPCGLRVRQLQRNRSGTLQPVSGGHLQFHDRPDPMHRLRPRHLRAPAWLVGL